MVEVESDIFVIGTLNGVDIRVRKQDGYWDGTAIALSDGKLWAHYYGNKGTQDYIGRLSLNIGIPILTLVDSPSRGQGVHTWVHPKVALHLAYWCSVDVQITVVEWIFKALETESAATGIPLEELLFRRILASEKRKYGAVVGKLFVQHVNGLAIAERQGIEKTPEMKGPIHWAGVVPNELRRTYEIFWTVPVYEEAKRLKETTKAKAIHQVVDETVAKITLEMATGMAAGSSSLQRFYALMQEVAGGGALFTDDGLPHITEAEWYKKASASGWDPQLPLFH